MFDRSRCDRTWISTRPPYGPAQGAGTYDLNVALRFRVLGFRALGFRF